MKKPTPQRKPHSVDPYQETLASAEKVVTFYEDCLEALMNRNLFLEEENARLKSLLKRYKKGRCKEILVH
jgi:hypothetical protein